ncbi:MAG: UvrD-helicase domain-containing protein [Kofleriaceae bacterium]|nr:UvrD-helicase domain-containing protein [Kofleriaceae bacterium]
MALGLNPEQEAAVEHTTGPLLVLAGAGTGKTRVLVHRIARLVELGTPPWEILAVTFTNKAAGEMRERLRGLLGDQAGAMWIGTFHATCARLLRRYPERVGLTRSFAIFDDDDQMKLVGRLIKEHGLDDQIAPRTVLSRIDRAKNRGVSPLELAPSPLIDDALAVLYPAYQAQLLRENAVDFGDLILYALRLARDPDLGPRLATMFRHVLVDEFQDTNRVQYDLVQALASATRNLTVVGDDDQSIYGWRGAEPRNLLDFQRDYPDATAVKLERNYRSTQVILDAANAVIAKNRDRLGKALWTEQAGGDPIPVVETGDERSEAQTIARAIRTMIDDGPMSPSDIAILYRTNAQSRVLEEHLRAYRVPAKVFGAVSFFERKEVRDCVAYLRLVASDAADSALERVVNAPTRGIGETTVERLRAAARAEGGSLLAAARGAGRGEVAGLTTAVRRKLAGFAEIIDGLRAVISAGASVAELVIQTVERSSMRERLEADDTQEARDRLANLAELVTTASDFDEETEGKGTLDDFLERIALSTSAEDVAESGQGGDRHAGGKPDVVSLMTVHVAKGLEFPVVFLAGMEDGLFPSLREREGQDDQAALEEERRLAYVAMTRARQRLVLSLARTRRVWGDIKMSDRSRFIDDIPPSCLALSARPRVVSPSSGPGASGGGFGAGPGRAGGAGAGAGASYGGGWSRARPAGGAGVRRPARDELDQRTFDDDVPVYSLGGDDAASAGYRPGQRVNHASFGQGKVVEAAGAGGQQRLVIEFAAGIGRKTVLARFVAPVG